MDTSNIISTQAVLNRCWKVTVEITVPSFNLVIERNRNGMRSDEKMIRVMKDGSFNRRRQAVRNLCIANGSAFDGGYIIPDERIDYVISEATKIGREFLAAVPTVLTNWGTALDSALAEATPEEYPLIQAANARQGGAAGLASALSFRLSKYRLNPDDDSIPLDLSGIEQSVRGMAGQIAHEIAQETRHGAPSLTGNLSAWRVWLSSISSKLEALAFVNPNLESLQKMIQERVIPALTGKGRVDETNGFILGGVLRVLSDPHLLVTEGAPVSIERTLCGKEALPLGLDPAETASDTSEFGDFSDFLSDVPPEAILSVDLDSDSEDLDLAPVDASKVASNEVSFNW